MKLDNKPKHLTKLFYDTYAGCCEVLQKEQRQYCIALFTVDGITFAIPFRTNINHKHCYIFKKLGFLFSKTVTYLYPKSRRMSKPSESPTPALVILWASLPIVIISPPSSLYSLKTSIDGKAPPPGGVRKPEQFISIPLPRSIRFLNKTVKVSP